MGPEGPVIRSRVGDSGFLRAVGIDHHVGAGPIAQGATLAGRLGALFNAGGTVDHAGRIGHASRLDQEGAPPVGRGLQIIGHAIARGLADALKVLSPGLAPLVRVAGVALATLENLGPDLGRYHGRIASSPQADGGTVKDVPAVADLGIASPPVAFPDRTGGLAPVNVARPLGQPVMDAVPADALGRQEGLHRVEILPQNPDLQHAAGLAVGGSLAQARHNADNGSPVDRAQALPQDPAIHVRFDHRILRASESGSTPMHQS